MYAEDLRPYRPGYNPAFVHAVTAKQLPSERKVVKDEPDASLAEAELASIAERLSLPFWVQDIIRDVAAEYGVLPSELMGRSTKTLPACARRKAMYEVKKCTPILSSAQIGHLFERTTMTVLVGIASYAAEYGLPSPYDVDIEGRRFRRNRRNRTRHDKAEVVS